MGLRIEKSRAEGSTVKYQMSISTLEKFKNQLLEDKERLEKELNGLAKKGRRGFRVLFKNFGSQDDEHAESVATMDNNSSLEKNLEKALKEIDKAIGKLDQGQYGICDLCGAKIAPQRLKIFPAANTCISCAKNKNKT